MSKNRKTLICIKLLLILIVIAVSAYCTFYLILKLKDENYATSHKNAEQEIETGDEELVAALNNTVNQVEASNTISEAAEAENAEAQPESEAITDCAVKLLDVYAERGSTVIFKCYDAEAESYEWEYYDLSAKEWIAAASEDVKLYEDELHRQVSGLTVKAEEDNHERMVRCILHFPTKEEQVQEASLLILKDQIEEIAVEDITVDANVYLRAMEFPVNVTYQDGSTELITGLYGVYFVSTEEEKESSKSISGNRVETTTLITTECDYLYIAQEEKSVPIRYHPEAADADALETSCMITGKDLLAPVISSLDISPYEVSNIDKAVTLTINISAEDDITPYPELEYAFLYADQEPTDGDWIRKASFDVSIERNGTYIAYVRDQAGNIATMEKKIITVDNKAPVISSIALSCENGWCKSNTIIVDAQDSGNMSYRFVSKNGTDTDWITYSEYAVETNGTWLIQVKDSAGNISEGEIVISNIDREAPIIKSINVR